VIAGRHFDCRSAYRVFSYGRSCDRKNDLLPILQNVTVTDARHCHRQSSPSLVTDTCHRHRHLSPSLVTDTCHRHLSLSPTVVTVTRHRHLSLSLSLSPTVVTVTHHHSPQPKQHCVRWVPSSPPRKGSKASPNFRPMSVVAKQPDGSRWHLSWR